MDRAASQATFEAELLALVPHLRAFGRYLCGDVAYGEDLAQEALVRAWASRDSFKVGTNMKAWTFLILRNCFYSDRRRSWRSTPLEPAAAEQMLVADAVGNDRLELDELRRALAMLPAMQREAILLVGAAGLTYDEVATMLDCPIGTVKSRVNRARDALESLCAEGGLVRDGRPPIEAMAAILGQVATCRVAA